MDDLATEIETGRAALAAHRWAEARAAFDAILAVGEDPDARFGRGIATWWLDETQAAMRDWEQAYVSYTRRHAFEAAVIAAVYLALAASMSLGNAATARGWAARADRLARDHDLGSVRGWVAVCLAHLATDEGHPEAGRQYAEEGLTAARGGDDPDLELCLLAELGLALVELGRAEDGARLLDEAMAGAMSGEVRDPDSVVLISCRSITASTRSGDVRRAVEWIGRADAFHERHGSAHLYTTCRLEYGNLLFATGAWARAEHQLEQARAVAAVVEPALRAAASAALAELRVAQGRLDEASRLVTGLDDFPGALPAIALVHLRRGDVSPAAGLLRRRLRDIDEGTLQASVLQERLGEAEVAAGNVEAARALGMRLLDHGRRSGNVAIMARAHRTLGRVLLAAAAPGATDHLDEAVTRFGRIGLPYDAAISRHLLARAAADVDLEAAVAEARAALAAFEQLGAARDADATAALLRSLGVRPARRGIRSLGTLTHREREVLVLLGEGLSNPEIGDRLFITRKTVEHHVGNVLGKLGLSGRAEAAAFAVRSISEDQVSK